MKKILIGAERMKGSFTDENKNTRNYDNILLYASNFAEKNSVGFTLGRNSKPIKIKTENFFDVVGVSPEKFFAEFITDYMFHKMRVIGEENDYGEFDVSEIQISDEDCYELLAEMQESEKSGS